MIKKFLPVLVFILGAHAGAARGAGLSLATYWGGRGEDWVRDVTSDLQGNIYVAGGTNATDFPTTPGAYDRALSTGGTALGSGGIMDVFVSKFSPQGQLIWSTYLGGPNYDRAYAIEVNAAGEVFLAGRAGPGFPTTAGVLQGTFGGDSVGGHYGQQDGFVAKISADGSTLLWSTYFGGGDGSFNRDLDIDAAGNVYIYHGHVSLPCPHVTPGAYHTSLYGSDDAVIAKLSPDGRRALFATYIGGSGLEGGEGSIRVNAAGEPTFATNTQSPDMPTSPGAFDGTLSGPTDMYVAKFSADGARLIYGTYLGGGSTDGSETHNLALDPQGNAVVAALTRSTDFPTTPGAYDRTYNGSGGATTGANTNYPGDGFIAVISTDGTKLLHGTYFGGRFGDGAEGVAVDAQGRVAITGATFSDDLPVTPDARQATLAGGGDAFAAVFSADLSTLLHAGYLGGSGTDYGRNAHMDAGGRLLIGGETGSSNGPFAAAPQPSFGGGASDGFFAAIDFPFAPPAQTGDLNNDGRIDVYDLSLLLYRWNSATAGADINGDNRVDAADLSLLLAHWS